MLQGAGKKPFTLHLMFFLRSLTCLMSVFEILVEADTAFRCLARLGLDRWPSLCYPKTGLFIPVKLRPCE